MDSFTGIRLVAANRGVVSLLKTRDEQLVKRGEDGAVEEDSLNIEEARGRMIAEGY